MSGLRESKKAATRAQIARAAAGLALEHGAEALTVAAVSEAAGVSTRTFHNYFTAMDEALLEFMVGRVTELINQLHDAPADAGLLDAIRWVIIEGLRGEAGVDTHLDSFARPRRRHRRPDRPRALLRTAGTEGSDSRRGAGPPGLRGRAIGLTQAASKDRDPSFAYRMTGLTHSVCQSGR
jgi:AcrR family transcriptional regulator